MSLILEFFGSYGLPLGLLAASFGIFCLAKANDKTNENIRDLETLMGRKHREYDLQIGMLNQRLKIQREDSMARAIKDATDNPEKYLVQPPAQDLEFGSPNGA